MWQTTLDYLGKDPVCHVVPLNDLQKHDKDSNCECNPSVEYEIDKQGNHVPIYVHNSYDHREDLERSQVTYTIKSL